MSAPQDATIGLVAESTYGTNTTVTRWFEFLPSDTFEVNKTVKQGAGLRLGSRVDRSTRRVVTRVDPTAKFDVECLSKGMGLLWQACLGSGTSTLVSGSTFQQLFTFADSPSSYTIQRGVINAAGTVDAYTFPGMMVDNFEIDFPNADLVTLKTDWQGKSVTTATAYAAPTMPTAAASLYHFGGAAFSTGTVTAPTSTALATAATPLSDIRGGNIKVSRNLQKRPNAGGDAKETPAETQISVHLDVEYDATTLRDAIINDTDVSLVLNFVTPTALSTGVETLQFVLPVMRAEVGLPQTDSNLGISVQGIDFTGLDGLVAAQPFWVVTRTSDAAL